MRSMNLGGWLVVGAVSLSGACGDSTNTTVGESQTGSSTGGDTNTPTGSGADTTSGSNSATETGGSNSATDSATTSPTSGSPTSSPTSDPTGDPTGNTTGDPTGNTTSTSGDSTGPVSASDTTTGDTTSGSTTNDTGVPLGPCDKGNKWTVDAEFDQGIFNNINHDAPNNDQLQITIDGFSAPKPYMFAAQTSDGWLLKLDTVTGKQLARYETVRKVDCPSCDANRNTWYPSRVVVDLEGDVYVANRAFGYQGSVTKIAGGDSGCNDRNKNGSIETSNDANNDGIIDVNSPAEFFGQNDECVLYTIPVGVSDTYPRALTIDGKGNAYVGTYQDMKAYKLDVTQTPPKVTKTISLPSTPYGFNVRGDYLYASALGQPVMRVDLLTDTVKTMNAPGNYGIAVDQNGIAWFGGSGLQRCDFEIGGNCENKGGGGMNGVSVDADGQLWGASGGTLYKFSNAGTQLGTLNIPNTYGVAIGHDGKPRVLSAYAAHEIDPGPVGGAPVGYKTYNTGIIGNPNIYNYTYTDFTGFGALNVTIKKGEWTVIHDSKDDNAQWVEIVYNTEKEAKIPVGTTISFQMRAAVLKADLAATPWTDVTDGVPEKFQTGRFVEIRARLLILQDDLEESPVLSDVCVVKEGD
ncbi:hypothetical protein [Nannocystis sp.]|uniref:hypothetical protein n=1 Tax=Nannocystis sp. TaxID=1962667 RepID=UPI0025DE0F21|nr:hypothetical protein [Nannocystis sp.]MBK7829689.1 hypothetical protein [Nannocystis sp.]